MTPETRRRALLAAQKIALSITMAGCANVHDMNAGSDAGEHTDLGAAVDDAGSTPMEILDAMMHLDATLVADAGIDSDAQLWADLGTALDGGVAVDGGPAVNECRTSIYAYVATAEPGTPLPAREGDEQCCVLIQNQIDGDGSVWGEWDDAGARSYCCGDVLAWTSGGSCTPWGPPMPPAMPSDEAFA